MINQVDDIVVLVVDDDKSHFEIISRMIRKSSIKIHSIINCSSYEETLGSVDVCHSREGGNPFLKMSIYR